MLDNISVKYHWLVDVSMDRIKTAGGFDSGEESHRGNQSMWLIWMSEFPLLSRILESKGTKDKGQARTMPSGDVLICAIREASLKNLMPRRQANSTKVVLS